MTNWQAPEQGEPIDPNAGGTAPGYWYGPQPGYPAYGYPTTTAPGYPTTTAPGYPPYGYPPAAGYPPYGYPSSPRDVRPGIATASAVLGFVTAGLLILAGLLLFLGGAIAGDVEDSFDSGTHIGLELTLDGVANLVAGGLLIAGGVLLVGRKPAGRILLSVGGGIVLAAAVYWIVRFDDVSSKSFARDASIFVILALLTLVFAWTTPVSRWLHSPTNRV